jgi:hypothetical protein
VLQNPYACLGDAVQDSTLVAGDTIQVATGTYNECVVMSQSGASGAPITIKSQTQGGATIAFDSSNWECPHTLETFIVSGSWVTVDGFKITEQPGQVGTNGLDVLEPPGIHLTGDIIKNCEIFGMGDHVNVNNGGSGIVTRPIAGTTNLNLSLTNNNVHDNTALGIDIVGPGVTVSGGQVQSSLHGIWLEGANNIVDGVHIHHNLDNGILEPHDTGLNNIVRNCEIDNNGRDFRYSHGLYMSGVGSLIQNNRIHHNGGYGIHLYPTPQNYTVERNEIFANGEPWYLPNDYTCSCALFCRPWAGGIVVSVGLGVAANNVVRYNVIHHNLTLGVQFYGDSTGTTSGNVFHHNTIYGNRYGQVAIADVVNNLSFKNNIVVGSDLDTTSAYHYLMSVSNSTMGAGDLDGNLFFHGVGSDKLLFYFNNAANPYTFAQWQANSLQDAHSVWSATANFVDPDMSPLNERGKPSNGDYHLRIGSSAISGVCCVSGTTGSLDVDSEQPSTCSPANCSGTGNGIGADYYKDTDHDGTADLYDCAPTNASDASLCDGDQRTQTFEQSKCTHPGAAYLASIYPKQGNNPGAPEVCDGNDNDCIGGVTTEVDADEDGFLTCGTGGLLDCNDGDAKIYPGALQFCDGKNNVCGGAADPTDIDTDGDGYFDCWGSPISPPGSEDCEPNNCCANPEPNVGCSGGSCSACFPKYVATSC